MVAVPLCGAERQETWREERADRLRKRVERGRDVRKESLDDIIERVYRGERDHWVTVCCEDPSRHPPTVPRRLGLQTLLREWYDAGRL